MMRWSPFLVAIAVSIGPSGTATPILPCGLETFGGQTRAFNGAPLADRTIYVVTHTGTSSDLTAATRPLHGGGAIDVYEGSFHAAMMHNRLSPDGDGKLIIFETSGTITSNKTYFIPTSYLTIAGQTAPSPGITLRGTSLVFAGHDVLVQHLRVRPGDWIPRSFPADTPAFRDGLSVGEYTPTHAIPYNVVIDHCSISWAIDETMNVGASYDGAVAHDITFNQCIIAEGLNNSLHEKAHHSAGSLFGELNNGLLYGILWAHHHFRQPATGAPGEFAVVNNLIYNPGDFNSLFRAQGVLKVSYVGNRVIGGNNSNTSGNTLPCIGKYINADSEFFVDDNQSDAGVQTGPDDWSLLRNWSTGVSDLELQELVRVLTPPVWPAGLTVLPVNEVQDMIVAEVGARPTDRDAVDARLISDVLSGGSDGRIIDCTEPGTLYWPVGSIASATATSVTLAPFDSSALLSDDTAENGRYDGMTIEITAGAGAGQTRVISSWDAPTLTGDVEAWGVEPDDTSEYRVHVDCSNNAGGYPTLDENRTAHVLPADPHEDADSDGYTNLEEWLHAFALEVEGSSCDPPVAPAAPGRLRLQ